jgi:hypothetical protein
MTIKPLTDTPMPQATTYGTREVTETATDNTAKPSKQNKHHCFLTKKKNVTDTPASSHLLPSSPARARVQPSSAFWGPSRSRQPQPGSCRRRRGRARLLLVHGLHLGMPVEERLRLLRRRLGLRLVRGRRRAVRRRRWLGGVRPGRWRRRAELEVLLLELAAGARDGGEDRVGRGREVGGVAAWAEPCRRDPGQRRTVARRFGRAVELRVAVFGQLVVVAEELGSEWDAESAGVVEGGEGFCLVGPVGAGLALDGYLEACNAPRKQKGSS